MELGLGSLLGLILLGDCVCVRAFRHESATHGDGNDRRSERPSESLSLKNLLQVRSELSLHIRPGETVALHCGDTARHVQSQFWQTPFGQFEGCVHQNRDPVKTCNDTLTITRATFSHDGLYYCIRLEDTRKTMIPYRVHVMTFNTDIKKRTRKTRQADDFTKTVSESHFVAAIASSVIVSFLVAFTLGAFSRSYVIKCLRFIRVHLFNRKHDHSDGQVVSESVFFHKNHIGEDVVDVGLPDEQRRIFSRCVENVGVENGGNIENGGNTENGGSVQNGGNVEIGGNIEKGGNVENGVNNESVQQSGEGELQTQEFRSVVSPHPKKKIRVIKVYNYDEDGKQYGHIREVEDEEDRTVRPKLRSRSLTRLNAIMKQAESLEFSPRESTPTDEDSETQDSSSQTHL